MLLFRRGILLVITCLVFSCLYAPQPVLPYLSECYHATPCQTSELITRIMLMLCLGSLLSGLFLRTVPARIILLICIPPLGVLEYFFAYVDNIHQALALKTVEGALFSIILPVLMTALADTSGKSGSAVVWYVSASVSGSVIGRLISGFLISTGHHSDVWISTGLSLLVMTPFLLFLEHSTKQTEPVRIIPALKDVLSRKDIWACLFIIFISFCTLISVLNYLPFHARNLYPDITANEISFLYSGYFFAIFSSMLTPAARSSISNDQRLIRLILLLLLSATLLLTIKHYAAFFLYSAMICCCFFMLHGCLSTYLNQHIPEHRRVVNGVYLTSYYLGGAFSSMVPGHIFMLAGWLWLLVGLSVLLCLAIAQTNKIKA